MDLFHPTPEVEVRPSSSEDVHFLANRLRAEDLAEIVAASGETPVAALGRGFVASRPCWTVLFRGEPSAMFGIVPTEDVDFARLGRVWFLGSDRVRLWGKTFTKFTAEWLAAMGKDFDVLGCTVDLRQVAHLKWLKAVGFRPVCLHNQFGALGLPFVEMAVSTDDIHPEGA